MGDLSTHFSRREFRSRDGAPLPVHTGLYALVSRLEALRCMVGSKPLRIVSGHRSAAHNAAVGGAKASQHLHAKAADIPEGYATVEQARAAGFTGIGRKGRWAVHVDVRDQPAEWTY